MALSFLRPITAPKPPFPQADEVPVWMVGGKPKPGKLLLAYDGSEGADKAVAHVAQMAGQRWQGD